MLWCDVATRAIRAGPAEEEPGGERGGGPPVRGRPPKEGPGGRGEEGAAMEGRGDWVGTKWNGVKRLL